MVRKILIASVLLAVLYYIGFSYYVASKVVAPVGNFPQYSAKVVSQTFEDVSFKTNDGLTLKGWFFPSGGTKAILMVAGYSADRVNRDYESILIAQDLLPRGYSVMLYDSRAHGASDGKAVTFGLRESSDVVSAVSYLKSRGYIGKDIGIIADSTGAISTLLAADRLKDVGAMVLDSPAAVYKPIIHEILRREKHVWPLVFPGTDLFLKYAFGLDLDVLRPVDKLPLVPERKFLYLHGEIDDVIPLKNSQMLLAKSNPQSKLVVFKGAKHVASFRTDPILFKSEVYGFLKSELGN